MRLYIKSDTGSVFSSTARSNWRRQARMEINMSIFFKQFITMMCAMLLSFMILGNILVHTAFETTINRETNQGMEEMKIFQYAMLASLEGLPDDYQAIDMAVAEIAQSIRQSLYGDQGGIVVYDKKNTVIYQDSDHQSQLVGQDRAGHNGAWQIASVGGHYYFESLCEISSTAGDYILEIHRSMDHVYQDRERLYDRYLVLLFIVTIIFAVILLFLSLHFTRPVRRLSQATRAFADGDYQRRVKVKGSDEMAVLGCDFNQMASQLEESIGQLKEEARRQEEFTAAFSHELKTPLTSIIGYADILRSRSMSEEERSISANYIVSQGRRLERLALKMLEMSFIDGQEIQFQNNEVSALAANLRDMTDKLLLEKEIQLVIQTGEGTVYGDRDLLLSLFSNLVDNARKACQERGTIQFLGEKTEEGYRIRIIDDGCGMPEEEIHKITEPFYMIDKSRARKEGGAGIGMALCQKILEMHHARWHIESRQGEGTRISILFPGGGHP